MYVWQTGYSSLGFDFIILLIIVIVSTPSMMSMFRACDYIFLYGKPGFADAIQLRVLRWGSILNHPGELHISITVFIKGKQETETERRRYNNGRKELD